MIVFVCPSCNGSLEVEDEAAGSAAPCPVCNTSIIIPAKLAPKPINDIPTRVAPRFPRDEPQGRVSAKAGPAGPRAQITYSLSARRKRADERRKKDTALFWFFASLAILFLGMVCGNGSASVVGFISLVAAGIYIAPQIRQYAANAAKEAAERQRQLQAAVDALIQKHADALRIKRLQKRRPDGYGNIVDEEWNREMEYFCQKVLRPAFPQICDWSLLDRFPRTAKQPLNARAPGILDAVFLSERVSIVGFKDTVGATSGGSWRCESWPHWWR